MEEEGEEGKDRAAWTRLDRSFDGISIESFDDRCIIGGLFTDSGRNKGHEFSIKRRKSGKGQVFDTLPPREKNPIPFFLVVRTNHVWIFRRARRIFSIRTSFFFLLPHA